MKAECRVRPPVSKVAATSLDAVAIAIWPFNLIFARIKFKRNVLPVPPGASTKVIPQRCVYFVEK